MKYLFDQSKGLLHDCTCKNIVSIRQNLTPLADIPAQGTFKLAPCCFRRLMIRKGVPSYMPCMDMDAMIAFFDCLGATDEQMKVLFRDLNSTFLYQSPTQCILYVKDDTWKIEILPHKELKLYHNNYRVNKYAYNRQFNRGFDAFHEQNLGRRRATFDDVFWKITQYSWEDHVDYLKEKGNKKQI